MNNKVIVQRILIYSAKANVFPSSSSAEVYLVNNNVPESRHEGVHESTLINSEQNMNDNIKTILSSWFDYIN